jgi:hypothetical protein
MRRACCQAIATARSLSGQPAQRRSVAWIRAVNASLLLFHEGRSARAVVALRSDHGEVQVVPGRGGARGCDDLRRAAERRPIGLGLRPSVASTGDLARVLSALGREQGIPNLIVMRDLIEFERGWAIERSMAP